MRLATLVPAYGRDYPSAGAALAAFNGDRDFLLQDPFSRWHGKPINKSQVLEAGYTSVKIRYRHLQSVLIHDLDEEATQRDDRKKATAKARAARAAARGGVR